MQYCPRCGSTRLVLAALIPVIQADDGDLEPDTQALPELIDSDHAACNECEGDGRVRATYDGPDPDERLEQKEAREHTERWVGGPDDHSNDGDALASAGLGTDEDYGG